MTQLLGCALLCLALGACAMGTVRPEAPGAAQLDVADAARQVLVLLHMPPPHFRPDAGYAGVYREDAGRPARRRLATQLARERGLVLVDDWPMPSLGVDCYVMSVPPYESAERAAEALSRDPRVAWAQTMNVYRTQGHADPLYALQPTARVWRLSELHALATGRQVRVAVIDSGVEAHHPDLEGRVVLAENFVDPGPPPAEVHGTAVAGIIAARADNGIGIVGVAPNARLLALRACRQAAPGNTLCTTLGLAKALQFARAHDAQVINLSLSGPPDRLLARLLDAALARGIAVVGAVDRGAPGGGFPASHPGVVAVDEESAHDAAGSSLVAPGRDVPTTVPLGRWALVSGASYAAAQVSGLFALLGERRPSLGGAQARQALALWPAGGVDACATLLRSASANTGACASLHAARPDALR
jgi:subtilisin family serine protease